MALHVVRVEPVVRQSLFGKNYSFRGFSQNFCGADTFVGGSIKGEILTPHGERRFWVIVDGDRQSDSNDDKWVNLAVSVESAWEPASEQEKFEVLAAIRKLYRAAEKSNIRGVFGQSPDQVGQKEGFTRLCYQHADKAYGVIDIVKPVEVYCRLSPFED